MKITNVEPNHKVEKIAQTIRENLANLGMSGDVYIEGKRQKSIEIINVRLLQKVYHLKQYEGDYRYKIIWENEKPFAQHTMLNASFPIHKANYLQIEDWAVLDEALNKICDELGVSAKITSNFARTLVIRDGTKNTWFENFYEICMAHNVYPKILDRELDIEPLIDLVLNPTTSKITLVRLTEGYSVITTETEAKTFAKELIENFVQKHKRKITIHKKKGDTILALAEDIDNLRNEYLRKVIPQITFSTNYLNMEIVNQILKKESK